MVSSLYAGHKKSYVDVEIGDMVFFNEIYSRSSAAKWYYHCGP